MLLSRVGLCTWKIDCERVIVTTESELRVVEVYEPVCYYTNYIAKAKVRKNDNVYERVVVVVVVVVVAEEWV